MAEGMKKFTKQRDGSAHEAQVCELRRPVTPGLFCGEEEDVAGEGFGGGGGVADDAPGAGAQKSAGDVPGGEEDGGAAVDLDFFEVDVGDAALQLEVAVLAELDVLDGRSARDGARED